MTDDIIEPRDRAKGKIKGVPVELAGREWLLPETIIGRAFDAIRDRLFDDSTLTGQVDRWMIRIAAATLLGINYQLSKAEAAALLDTADDAKLTKATMDALMGPDDALRSFSSWARSALLANGLDPRAIPAEDLNFVLFQLVATGRAVTLDGYCHASIAVAERRELLEG